VRPPPQVWALLAWSWVGMWVCGSILRPMDWRERERVSVAGRREWEWEGLKTLSASIYIGPIGAWYGLWLWASGIFSEAPPKMEAFL
jgi:hypothetical protein